MELAGRLGRNEYQNLEFAYITKKCLPTICASMEASTSMSMNDHWASSSTTGTGGGLDSDSDKTAKDTEFYISSGLGAGLPSRLQEKETNQNYGRAYCSRIKII